MGGARLALLPHVKRSLPKLPFSCSALWKTETDNASLYNLNIVSLWSLDVMRALSSIRSC